MTTSMSAITGGLIGAVLAGRGPADRITSPSPGPAATASVQATSSGGALIIRDQTRAYYFDLDADHQLLSVHMPVWDLSLCGGTSFFDVVERTRIITPSDVEQFLVHISDDQSSVGVFRAVTFEEAGLAPGFDRATFCAFINSSAKIAQGSVHHVQNLSNGSFSSQWGGKIAGDDGTRYAYSESYQLTADTHDPADASQWVEHVTHIKLSSLPR
jgi:hypothetical protein